MNKFSIKDIENLTGIKAHTLRIWEQRYGILKPKRTDTNIRYYDANDLKHALAVALLNKQGYKISRINNMNDAEINKIIDDSSNQDLKLEALANRLLDYTVQMNVNEFEQTLNDYIAKNRLENTIESLIFKYLEKVGVMWMTNKIFPAQEHLITNIISRKLHAAIDKLDNNSSNTPKVLLFLPEGEIHELGLLYAFYILLKNKKHVIYLGPNSPINQVELVCQNLKPDFLYTHITSVSNDFDPSHYFKLLSHIHPQERIFASGSMLQKAKIDPNKTKIQFMSTLEEAKKQLSQL